MSSAVAVAKKEARTSPLRLVEETAARWRVGIESRLHVGIEIHSPAVIESHWHLVIGIR